MTRNGSADDERHMGRRWGREHATEAIGPVSPPESHLDRNLLD